MTTETRTVATIYNRDADETIADGLDVSARSNQAINMARDIAKRRDEAVILEDDDGTWAVFPDGEAVQGDTDERSGILYLRETPSGAANRDVYPVRA